ncbi:MAG TPA: hypothetical protein VGB70_03135 [Allosphingosinicella sp.]|jgi:hypothetical protein
MTLPRPGRPAAAAVLLALLLAAGLLLEEYALAFQAHQRRADVAAVFGAHELVLGNHPEKEARIGLLRNWTPPPGTAYRIEWPPTAGPFAGRRGVVRVTMTTTWRSRFAPFLSRRVSVRSSAVALRSAKDRSFGVGFRIE